MNSGPKKVDGCSSDEVEPLHLKKDANNCSSKQKKRTKRNVFRRLCACPIAVGSELQHQCETIDCKKIVKRTFSLETLRQRIPIVGWVPKYRLHHLQGDLIAGITVGLTVLPQSLAYAKIAELPPQYGLYTAFMACFVYCLLGTSKDVNLGPAAVMSLLTAEFGHSVIKGDATYAIALSMICGIVQIAMGILHIGFLVDYISHPVISSFTTAAAITIACSQLKKWLGLHGIPRGFIPQIYTVLKKLPETHLWDFLMGLVCMVILYILKRLKDVKWKKSGNQRSIGKAIAEKTIWITCTARNAIVVILASVVAAVLYSHDKTPFTLTGNITSGVPPFRTPSFSITHENQTYTATDMFEKMGIGLIMVPVLGVIEIIAVGKAFGRKNGYNVDANQELFAIGFSNLLGSFVSAYPVTASFSRSAVNAQSGSMTTAAGAVTGAMVVLALAFLTPLFYYIPDPALAAVIIMAVTDMIDFSMVKHLWKISKPELLPWFTAFFVSLGAGFEYGIILGVVVSLLILLYPWARPPVHMTYYNKVEKPGPDSCGNIVVIDVSMGLMFPGIEHLQEKIAKKAFNGDAKSSVILDFSSVYKVDYTCSLGIGELVEDFARHSTWLVFINVKPSILQTLDNAGVQIRTVGSMEEAVLLIKSQSAPDFSLAHSVVSVDNNGTPSPDAISSDGSVPDGSAAGIV